MSRSILLCVTILSTLFIGAVGQTSTLSAECMNAANSFIQESACFGSDGGVNFFLTSIGLNVMTSSMQGSDYSYLQPPIRTFYNNFCTSQYCVNRYADVIDICFRSNTTQVSICYHVCTFSLHEQGVVYK